MKISNSKKELARIISENGWWKKGNYAIQDKDDKCVWFMSELEGRPQGRAFWPGRKSDRIRHGALIPNWHQTILSRAEYFHLYPAPDAKPEFCESVMRSIPDPAPKPTIEQLATDYRNKMGYASRKQQEANDAKAAADAALGELERAGEALGLLIGIATLDPELVITDWRKWEIGDEVRLLTKRGGAAEVGEIGYIHRLRDGGEFAINFPSQNRYVVKHGDIEFIRRP